MNGDISQSRLFVVATLTACLAMLAGSASALADNPYPLGWYDAVQFHANGSPAAIADAGGNVVIAYANTTPADLAAYLDQSAAAGVGVILQVPAYYVINEDANWVRNYVSTYDGHAALRGWYLVDEPTGSGVSVANAQAAYQAVKQRTTKPVFITFARAEFENGAASAFADAYDVFLFDQYPFLASQTAEFSGNLGTWTSLVELAATQSQQLGKPWWSIPQGFGQQPDATFDKRLPTLNELRYQTYLSVLHGAQGLVSWAHYRAQWTLAKPDAAYPDDGEAWLDDVWRAVAMEFNEHGRAIAGGPVAGAVSDNRASILAEVYQDPDTGEHYLIAVNTSNTGTQPTFTLSSQFTTAVYLGEIGGDIPIVNGSFHDTFTRYAVHTYRLTPALVPEPGVGALLLLPLAAVGRRSSRFAWTDCRRTTR